MLLPCASDVWKMDETEVLELEASKASHSLSVPRFIFLEMYLPTRPRRTFS